MSDSSQSTPIAIPLYGPLEHADYPLLDQRCACSICIDWRDKKAIFDAALQIVISHQRTCKCAECKVMRRAGTAYHASNNRRDLYSEMSYLVGGKKWGHHAMRWLENEIKDPARTDGWWQGRAPYYSMASWLNRFVHSATTAVSGLIGETAAIAVSGTVV